MPSAHVSAAPACAPKTTEQQEDTAMSDESSTQAPVEPQPLIDQSRRIAVVTTNFPMSFLSLAALVLGLSLAVASDALAQCTKDTDCKGDRICANGTCMDPSNRSGSLAQLPAAASSLPGSHLLIPPSIGVVYYLNSDTQSLVPLQRQMGYTEKRGMIKQEIAYSVPQERSTVRIKSSPHMEFVVSGVDASSYLLYRFSVRDGKRELILAESTWTGSRANYTVVPLEVTRYAEAFKLVPSQPLVAGEYAFAQRDKNEAASFGIDGTSAGGGTPQGTMLPSTRGGSYQSPITLETDFAAADRTLWNNGNEFTLPDWYELGNVSFGGIYLRGDHDRKKGWDPFLRMRAKPLPGGNVEVKVAIGVQNPKHNEDKLVNIVLAVLNGQTQVASSSVEIKAKDDGEGHFKTVVFTIPEQSLRTSPMTKLRITLSASNY